MNVGLEWKVTLGLGRKVSWNEPNPNFLPGEVNLKLYLKKSADARNSRLVLRSRSGRLGKMGTGRQRSRTLEEVLLDQQPRTHQH